MKRILLSAAVFVLGTSAFAQAPTTEKKKVADVAKFSSETIDLGSDIKQGNPTKGTFIVTNISKEPLIIEQANPTCGCTISNYTKSPIEPGKTGEINATYNAANAGRFEKHLTVKFAGIDEIKTINLKGTVIPNPDANKAAAKPAEAKPAAPAPVAAPAKADTSAPKAKKMLPKKKPVVKKPVVAKKPAVPTPDPAKAEAPANN
jgi:hypothetical protein